MGLTEILLVGFALAVGGLNGFILGRKACAPVDGVSRADHEAMVRANAALEARLESEAQTAHRLAEGNDQLEARCGNLSRQVVQLEERNKNLEANLKEHQDGMRDRFKLVATEIAEQMGRRIGAQSEEKIGGLLKPVQAQLEGFGKMVNDSFVQQRTEQNTLKDEIGRIVLQADSLTKALRGDSKAQGNWGEVMLERILEQSELRKGEDYYPQGSGLGLSDEEGNRRRPDFVVRLPDNKHIIIDSKVSLTHYDRYFDPVEEGQRQLHLRQFLDSLRTHVNGLSSKDYSHLEGLGAPNFVFMFVPVEGAYALAVQQDRELQHYAWHRNIVIVPPGLLFSSLRTISSLWNIERQNRNVQEITKEAKGLYEKFVGFVDDMQAIDVHLTRLRGVYDDAANKLYKGTGNLATRTDKLRKLGGLTPKKTLGGQIKGFIDDESDAPLALEAS